MSHVVFFFTGIFNKLINKAIVSSIFEANEYTLYSTVEIALLTYHIFLSWHF